MALGIRRRGFSGSISPSVGAIRMDPSLPLVFGDGASDDWQLPSDHYRSSIHTFANWMPASTAAYAYHKRSRAGVEHRIRYPLAGGAQPLHGVVNSGPSGAEINNDYEDPDFGTLTIPNVPEQTGTLSTTWSSQDGAAPVTIEHTYEGAAATDTTKFIHLTAGDGGGQTGTPSAPFRNLGQIVGPDEDDASWQNRQVIVEGDHALTGQEAEYNLNGTRLIMNTNKPAVWRAVTRNGARWTGGANWHFETGTNVKFQGFLWVSPYADPGSGNARVCFIHAASAILAGGGTQDNDFNMQSALAPAGGSNSAGVFYAGGTNTPYCAHIGDIFRNCNNSPAIQVYNTSFIYFGLIQMPNMDTSEGIHLKAGANIDDVAMVMCSGYGLGNFSCIQSIQNGPPWSRERIEALHCSFMSTGSTGNLGRGFWFLGATGATYSIYSKRCNWQVPYHYAQNVPAGSYTSAYDVIQHSGAFTDGFRQTGGSMSTSITNHRIATSGLLASGAQLSPNYTQGKEIG